MTIPRTDRAVQSRFDREASAWYEVHRDAMRDITAWEVWRRKSIAVEWVAKRFERRRARILEIGCGAGENIRAILAIDQNWEAVGVDISEQMVHACRDRFALEPRARFDRVDADNEDLPDGQFDVVIMLGVIGYLKHPGEVIAKATGRLRRGGLLICTYGNRMSPYRWMRTGLTSLRGGKGLHFFDCPVSHFKSVRRRQFDQWLPESLVVKARYATAFSPGFGGRIGVALGRVQERMFGGHDPLGVAMTHIVVCERCDSDS